MTYIKKLVIQGFKSFPVRTEILFDRGMNLIVGANGSGKSNIADALCFVLGRLSIKSIRAAKAANLLFSGTKRYKPFHEAFVEMVLDNSDRIFGDEKQEISLKRVIKRNGLSAYKINNEVKTRQELLEILAQAGIDPHGFNIVLQGEIASLIKITSEERRKIIEEVAGISIYEARKQKSLRELEKTEEKLKEVSAVLRERQNYLKNLDREKQEALNYQRLEQTIKRAKASIINKNIKEKEKEIWGINKIIENQNNEIEKRKKIVSVKNAEINILEEKISRINRQIQSSQGKEQENLHKDISELKSQIASLGVRKENFEARIQANKQKCGTLSKKISDTEKEISAMAPSDVKKQQKNYSEMQEKIEFLEKQRRKFYLIKSELSSLENKRLEKQKAVIEFAKETEIIEQAISSLFEEIKHEKSIEKALILRNEIKKTGGELSRKIKNQEEQINEIEKGNAALKQKISSEESLKKDIAKLDICPLCRSKITKEHAMEVINSSNKRIQDAEKKLKDNLNLERKISEELLKSRQEDGECSTKLNEIEIECVKIRNADEKKEQIKKIFHLKENAEKEIQEINVKINNLRKDFENLKDIEERYEDARLKIQEISFADIDMDSEKIMRQREINRMNSESRVLKRDIEDSELELKSIITKLSEIEKELNEKEKQEKEFYERFQKLFEDKNSFQDSQKAVETDIIGLQHEIRSYEERINSVNIQKAQINAQIEALSFEFKEYGNLELYNNPIEEIKERLIKAEHKLAESGSVNMRALEIYDKVKEQCVLIEEKAGTIESEKQKIFSIINEIDKKKKKTFLKTLEAVNAYFTRNFSQLSRKGEVFLELENAKEPFEAGLNIIIKVGRGKYFDVSSLSGGEKTLVALSLIFAIQEYKPYCFYIFDEIDAALDKHNSERLASLIKHYMKSGQYIIITHNDALISEATFLYGVSMQEGISKIVSLKI